MPEYRDKSGRWRWRYTHRGKQYSGSTPKGTNTARAARELEKEHFERLQRRQFMGVMPKLAAFVDQVLEYQKAHTRELTYDLQESHFRIHIVPKLGKRRLDEIGAKDIDDLITGWKRDGAASTTINTRLGTLGRAFALAIEWGMLQVAPRIKLLKVSKDAVRFFTEDESPKLIDAARNRRGDRLYRWSSMMFVGLRTGLRVGELRGLEWPDIDFRRAGIMVQRSDPGQPGAEVGPTKGGKSRWVPLTPAALACLAAELAYRRGRANALSMRMPDRVWPGIEDATRGRPESSCVHAMASCLARAGIEDRDGDRLGWHTLRHTFASNLAMAGVPLRVIQDLLGHASIKQTEVYAHLAPNALHHSAVAVLDAAVIQRIDGIAPIGELGPGDDNGDK